MKTYDLNMKKAITLFTFAAISIYIFITLKLNNLVLKNVNENEQKATVVKRVHRETFNITADVTVKLERNDKYNWSYTSQLHNDYRQFAPAMNITEYTMYVNLIEKFKNACEAFNITYLLEGGSVLGAYRYHGFVPWDDDFDCKVNVSQKHILKEALANIDGHILLDRNLTHWKFFSKNFAIAGPYSWDWPFIDIFFFTENETHVYDVTRKEPRHFDPREDILPLENGVFENMIMPVPHNMEAYLRRKYNMKEPCQSNWWNHKNETYPETKSSHISCDELFGVQSLSKSFESRVIARLMNTL